MDKLEELLVRAADREVLGEILRRYFVSELRLFGSAAHGAHGPDSDIDLLVDFEPGHHPGWLVFDLQRDLESLFGRKIDLNTAAMFRGEIRENVLREAETIYGQT